MIKFNIPAVIGNEEKFIRDVIGYKKFSGDGDFNRKCANWIEQNFSCHKSLITSSCTHSLEMAAILADVKEGDEVIMPSFTFVSTANAFALRGAKIVFVDIRKDTMNIDEKLIEAAITRKTKVIVLVHYAGVSCEMNYIMMLAKKYNVIVVEDAAQGVMSTYEDKPLGTIAHFGCYSFHETKNIHCGEGGALLVNDVSYVERSEIIREKGTDRSRFFRGQIDKYSWVDLGSSYLLSEFNAGFLFGQLQNAVHITNDRLKSWDEYYFSLKELSDKEYIELPTIPDECKHNGHIFYIKVKDRTERAKLISFLKDQGIMSVFHYIPLHSSQAGKKFGRFNGIDRYTTSESERLVRLPLFYNMDSETILYIIEKIRRFFQ
ncbi:dTDP-4-amino-4,6-dideoxygalactose transaminase [Brevibacillus sp. Leaf182]|uniref:dTDP-4-amino-4,6-dideoxygalactose transaminase n=1 Tax=Brevibacillus sp. Leaf182 TaxID=1736290 RepID=UPI000701A2B9|nr:dTDP-4-amino-4,6-dideoxygalactose transaminase [Brevibacillus sp. Leaf182]RAT98713.1 dTDP-4-amino-4,6-dideoxygalactose transaminase [Brevibacillus sp. Leaf182]